MYSEYGPLASVSNSDGLYGAYDPSTALSIGTVTIRTDHTNRNTLCFDVIMRCTLGMCSEYGPLATLTVCTERTIRQLLLTVRNSATVLDMTVTFEDKTRSGTGQSLSKHPFYWSQTHQTASGSRNSVSESFVPELSSWQQHRLCYR